MSSQKKDPSVQAFAFGAPISTQNTMGQQSDMSLSKTGNGGGTIGSENMKSIEKHQSRLNGSSTQVTDSTNFKDQTMISNSLINSQYSSNNNNGGLSGALISGSLTNSSMNINGGSQNGNFQNGVQQSANHLQLIRPGIRHAKHISTQNVGVGSQLYPILEEAQNQDISRNMNTTSQQKSDIISQAQLQLHKRTKSTQESTSGTIQNRRSSISKRRVIIKKINKNPVDLISNSNQPQAVISNVKEPQIQQNTSNQNNNQNQTEQKQQNPSQIQLNRKNSQQDRGIDNNLEQRRESDSRQNQNKYHKQMSSKHNQEQQDFEYQRELSNLIQETGIDIEESEHIKYSLGELIGSGAYGKVYQGLDMSNGQLLAIKQIKFSLKTDALKKEVRAIKHEIQLLRELYHPNIVKYFNTEISADGDGVDILLEFVPGGSIRQLLDKFMAFDERLVKIYTRQMLEGLHYLHENKIIHRDLKCANVLVDNMGVVKLSDFGASKKIMQAFDQNGDYIGEKLSKSVIGSPFWMAPEIMQKVGHGKPADIWSLGCCVIEMLTSKPPWIEFGKDAKTIMNVIKNCKAPPKYPDNISKECKEFLDYCFELDQKKRPTAQELLFHPFVLMKNPKALQESMELAKLMQSRISQASMNSAFMKSFQSNGIQGYPQNTPYTKSINSVQSFNFNSQLNMGQFLQNHQQMAQSNMNFLEAPQFNYGNNLGSINSINSIMVGLDHPSSINVHSMMNASNQNLAAVQKSTSSFTSNNRLLSFAEKLKYAHEQQRNQRKEVAIQNWVRNKSINPPQNSNQQQQQQQIQPSLNNLQSSQININYQEKGQANTPNNLYPNYSGQQKLGFHQ